MNLIELSKMFVGSLRIVDKAKERNEPLKWKNRITIIHGKNSITVMRYTAYNHGFCEGAHGLPPQPQKSELRQNPGRKNSKMNDVTIKVSDEILAEFGGLRNLQKRIIIFLTSKI